MKKDYEVLKHAMRLFADNSEFCVFDLETTGKDIKRKVGEPCKTLQIAAQRYHYNHGTRQATLVGQMNVLLADPTITEINPYLTESVHHIGMAHIRDAQAAASFGLDLISDESARELYRAQLVSPQEGWARFVALLDGAVALGHNINSFDIPFAQADVARWDIGLPFAVDSPEREVLPADFAPEAQIHSIDTLLLSRLLWHRDNRRGAAGYKLRSMARLLGVKTDPALDHNAIGDINTNWRVFIAMLEPLRSYRSCFLSGKTPDQYRRMLPGLRDEIPGPEEYAVMRLSQMSA